MSFEFLAFYWSRQLPLSHCLRTRAHADTRNFALVRCDETAGELVVREDSTEEEVERYKTPEGYQSKWLDQLVEYISPPGGVPDDAVAGTYRQKTG
jgi:hypothetical protein